MTKSFESLHVHVEIEITGCNRNIVEYLQTLQWKRLQFRIQNKNETLDARSWQRQIALIRSELSVSCSSFCSLCWRLCLFVIFLWICFACFGWCSLSSRISVFFCCIIRWIDDRIELRCYWLEEGLQLFQQLVDFLIGIFFQIDQIFFDRDRSLLHGEFVLS